MNDQKQQIIEKLQAANNILVTVPSSPSVDQLSAAIGLTLLLNKMNKHASAVFSGLVPRSLGFLKPEETLERDTDSLRDFIVALDKSKADKLRYKVEDDVVKIFITPYKTSITEKDLVFSQGDFNVDVVLALGVLRQQDLDNAITAHGRILHDAVVISVNNKPNGELGTINWQDTTASGLAELVTGLAVEVGKELLDDQIATALLTGIVAETDHFGNQKTTPQTMTMSATLLAAGANQQLIAKELNKTGQLQQPGQPKKEQPQEKSKADIAQAGADGSLSIKHKPGDPRKKKYLAPKPLAKAPEDEQSIEDILRSSGAVSEDEPVDANTVITLPDPNIDPFEKVDSEDAGDEASTDELADEVETTDEDVEEQVDELADDTEAAPEEESSEEVAEEEAPAALETDQNDQDVEEEPEAEEPAAEPVAEDPLVVEPEQPDEPDPKVEQPAPEPQPEPATEPEQPEESAPEPLKVELPAPDLSINDLPGFEPSPSEPAPSAAVTAPAASVASDPLPELDVVEAGPESAAAPEAGETKPADVDEARKRVEDALKETENGLPQDFNAINVNLDLGHEDLTNVEVVNPGGDAALPSPAGEGGSLADLIQSPTAPAPDLGPAPAPGFGPIPDPSPAFNPSPMGMGAPAPVAQPLPPNPATNEQAPLSNSPADQPYTMPVPGPAPAAAPAPAPEDPKAAFGKTPAGLNVPPPTQFSPTAAANFPPQGPPPPPVPPPAMPPNFIPGP